MTREIKFRAWDKENKFFIFASLFDRTEMPFQATNEPPKEKEWTFKAPKELIWQQFTGLKDKNGKEIYEGDIVKENYKDKFGDDIIYELPEFPKDLFHRVGEGMFSSESIEVIGNIYENPELLS